MGNDMELNSVTEKKIYKTKKNISGTKARYISKISRDLRQQMIQNGATKEELIRFQYDFLVQNGINVPESFLNIRKNDDEYEILGKFIEKNLKASEQNLSGSYFYKKYIEYCISNQFRHIGKQEAFAYLRGKGLMKKSGTINGKTVRNVVIGYDFNLGGIEWRARGLKRVRKNGLCFVNTGRYANNSGSRRIMTNTGVRSLSPQMNFTRNTRRIMRYSQRR